MAKKKKVVEEVKEIEMVECIECEGRGAVDCPHCGAPEAETCDVCAGRGEVEKEEED